MAGKYKPEDKSYIIESKRFIREGETVSSVGDYVFSDLLTAVKE